jgi:hypothetical protein
MRESYALLAGAVPLRGSLGKVTLLLGQDFREHLQKQPGMSIYV